MSSRSVWSAGHSIPRSSRPAVVRIPSATWSLVADRQWRRTSTSTSLLGRMWHVSVVFEKTGEAPPQQARSLLSGSPEGWTPRMCNCRCRSYVASALSGAHCPWTQQLLLDPIELAVMPVSTWPQAVGDQSHDTSEVRHSFSLLRTWVPDEVKSEEQLEETHTKFLRLPHVRVNWKASYRNCRTLWDHCGEPPTVYRSVWKAFCLLVEILFLLCFFLFCF